MASPILRGKRWKSWSTASNSYSYLCKNIGIQSWDSNFGIQRWKVGIQTLAAIYAKTVEKT
jgi:hypothetical protein